MRLRAQWRVSKGAEYSERKGLNTLALQAGLTNPWAGLNPNFASFAPQISRSPPLESPSKSRVLQDRQPSSAGSCAEWKGSRTPLPFRVLTTSSVSPRSREWLRLADCYSGYLRLLILLVEWHPCHSHARKASETPCQTAPPAKSAGISSSRLPTRLSRFACGWRRR